VVLVLFILFVQSNKASPLPYLTHKEFGQYLIAPEDSQNDASDSELGSHPSYPNVGSESDRELGSQPSYSEDDSESDRKLQSYMNYLKDSQNDDSDRELGSHPSHSEDDPESDRELGSYMNYLKGSQNDASDEELGPYPRYSEASQNDASEIQLGAQNTPELLENQLEDKNDAENTGEEEEQQQQRQPFQSLTRRGHVITDDDDDSQFPGNFFDKPVRVGWQELKMNAPHIFTEAGNAFERSPQNGNTFERSLHTLSQNGNTFEKSPQDSNTFENSPQGNTFERSLQELLGEEQLQVEDELSELGFGTEQERGTNDDDDDGDEAAANDDDNVDGDNDDDEDVANDGDDKTATTDDEVDGDLNDESALNDDDSALNDDDSALNDDDSALNDDQSALNDDNDSEDTHKDDVDNMNNNNVDHTDDGGGDGENVIESSDHGYKSVGDTTGKPEPNPEQVEDKDSLYDYDIYGEGTLYIFDLPVAENLPTSDDGQSHTFTDRLPTSNEGRDSTLHLSPVAEHVPTSVGQDQTFGLSQKDSLPTLTNPDGGNAYPNAELTNERDANNKIMTSSSSTNEEDSEPSLDAGDSLYADNDYGEGQEYTFDLSQANSLQPNSNDGKIDVHGDVIKSGGDVNDGNIDESSDISESEVRGDVVEGNIDESSDVSEGGVNAHGGKIDASSDVSDSGVHGDVIGGGDDVYGDVERGEKWLKVPGLPPVRLVELNETIYINNTDNQEVDFICLSD